jgi:hypothetical protein
MSGDYRRGTECSRSTPRPAHGPAAPGPAEECRPDVAHHLEAARSIFEDLCHRHTELPQRATAPRAGATLDRRALDITPPCGIAPASCSSDRPPGSIANLTSIPTLRVWTQSCPVGDGGDEAGGGEEVASGLVVSGGASAEILDVAECSLDDVAQPVALGVMRDGNLARRGAGDDRGGAALGEKTTQVVGVVALVADEFAGRGHSRHQSGGGCDVGDVAAGQ